MHYTNETESRLAHESLKVFHDFANVVGGDCGFERAGLPPARARRLRGRPPRGTWRASRRLGIDTREVATDEVARLVPGCRVDDIGAAAYEPDSGFADPNATAYSFAEAARRSGATIRTHCEVTRVLVADAAR